MSIRDYRLDDSSATDAQHDPEMFRELEKKRRKNEVPVTSLSKLDRKHMLSILLYLKHHKPAIKSDIYSNISRNVNMASKLDTLHEMGLIGIYGNFGTNTNYLILTEKGEKVADLIEKMLEEIDKPVPEDQKNNPWNNNGKN